MRRILTMTVIAALVPAAAAAQLPDTGYIGLFADESHTEWCVTGTGTYIAYMYIICLPGVNGQDGVQFAVSYPQNVLPAVIEYNEGIIDVTSGNIQNGIGVYYLSCQYDWHWIIRHQLYVLNSASTSCSVVPHPESGTYEFLNCSVPSVEEPCTILTSLYFNYAPESAQCTEMAGEGSSWGAIKSVIRRQDAK